MIVQKGTGVKYLVYHLSKILCEDLYHSRLVPALLIDPEALSIGFRFDHSLCK